MAAISIIMPCYNQAYQLRRVLEAYDHQTTHQPFELIAIDDASIDETYPLLYSFHPQTYTLRLLHQEQNRGPAAARNLGLQIAASPLIAFVGDDILPQPTFIADHLQAHHIHPQIEIAILGQVAWPTDMPVNSLMKHIDGIGAQQFSYFYFTDQQEYDYRHFYTANISLKRDLLGRVDHFFDPDFQFAAYEDVELSYRLAKKGLRIIYDQLPLGHHYHYHQIWSFSERQYRAGLMALVICNKHPELRPQLLGKGWLGRVWSCWLKSFFTTADPGTALNLEQAALRRASSFEWLPEAETDDFYLKFLPYFYFKGILSGYFEEPGLRQRVLNAYMHRSLPNFAWSGAEPFRPELSQFLW